MAKALRIRFLAPLALWTAACAGPGVVAGDGAAARPKTLADLLDHVQAHSEATADLEADFTRTRVSKWSRRGPKVVKGRLVLKTPGMVKMEFVEPVEDARTLIVNDEEAWEIRPGAKNAVHFKFTKEGRAGLSPELRAFLAAMGRDLKELTVDYDLKLDAVPPEGEAGYYEVVAVKKEAFQNPYYKEMRFWISTETWMPVKVTGAKPDETVETWEFTNVKTNTEVKPSEFKWSPPLGWNVIEEEAK